jgi:hypothetical protein
LAQGDKHAVKRKKDVSVQLGNKTGVNPPKWGLANPNNSDIISQ